MGCDVDSDTPTALLCESGRACSFSPHELPLICAFNIRASKKTCCGGVVLLLVLLSGLFYALLPSISQASLDAVKLNFDRLTISSPSPTNLTAAVKGTLSSTPFEIYTQKMKVCKLPSTTSTTATLDASYSQKTRPPSLHTHAAAHCRRPHTNTLAPRSRCGMTSSQWAVWCCLQCISCPTRPPSSMTPWSLILTTRRCSPSSTMT